MKPTRRSRGETAQRLLDAAERLFGKHGYNGVGVRTLAQEAKVNLQAATYHFGSKKALYLETFLRRFRVVNSERLRLLDEAQRAAAGTQLHAEAILDCMMRPPFQMGLAHPAFSELLARSLVAPPPFLHPVLHRELEPNVAVFIDALQRALPTLPKNILQLRVMLAMGPLIMFTRQGRMPTERVPAREEAVLKELVRFAAGGLLAAPVSLEPEHVRQLGLDRRSKKASR